MNEALTAHINGSNATRGWLAVGTLLRREFTRFIRQKHRVFGALGQPILFLVLFGAGWSRSFQHPLVADKSYAEYFYPGTLVLVILFTAIFATISIIEDRTSGFLQSVLVSPSPSWSVALGKIFGSTALAMSQGIILLAIAPLLHYPVNLFGWLGAALVMALIAILMSSLGFIFAWRMDSVQGYHAVMNVVLVPMWLLSGAMFPAAGAAGWMSYIMMVNPLTYGTASLRHLLYLGHPEKTLGLPPLGLSLGLLFLFSGLAAGAAVWQANRPHK